MLLEDKIRALKEMPTRNERHEHIYGKAAVKRFNRKKHKSWDYEWDRDEDFI